MVIVVVGFVACLAANYPGHFTPDSIWQLAQGREGRFNDWHPPAMAWLLGLADRVSPGAGVFMVFDAALFYGGLLGFAILGPRPRPVGLVVLALCLASPLALIFQGAVLKDVLFADAALAGYAALAWVDRCWHRPVRRVGLVILAAGLFTIAGLTRQNGVVAPLFGAVAVVVLVWRHAPATNGVGARMGRALAAGGTAFALVVGLIVASTLAMRTHGSGPSQGPHHLKILQMWDLAGAVRLDPVMPLAALHATAPSVEAFLRTAAAPVYRSAGVDNIVNLRGGAVLTNPPGPALGEDWVRLMTTRPGLYLALRGRVWLDTLLTPKQAQCPMIYVGVDGGSPAMLRRAGLLSRSDDRDDWDGAYASSVLETPLFSHAAYGAVVLGLLGLSALRWLRGQREAGLIVGVALGLAGLTFAGSFFIVSVDCDYRFLYFLDVAAMGFAVSAACARGPPERQ